MRLNKTPWKLAGQQAPNLKKNKRKKQHKKLLQKCLMRKSKNKLFKYVTRKKLNKRKEARTSLKVMKSSMKKEKLL